jgi:hypothetical protein
MCGPPLPTISMVARTRFPHPLSQFSFFSCKVLGYPAGEQIVEHRMEKVSPDEIRWGGGDILPFRPLSGPFRGR